MNKITNICYFVPKPEQNNKYLLNICYFVILFFVGTKTNFFFVICFLFQQNNKITNICSRHDLLTKTKKSRRKPDISCFSWRRQETEQQNHWDVDRAGWEWCRRVGTVRRCIRAQTQNMQTPGQTILAIKIIHSMRRLLPGKWDFPRNMGLIKIRNWEPPRISWKTLKTNCFFYNSKNGCRIPEAPNLNPWTSVSGNFSFSGHPPPPRRGTVSERKWRMRSFPTRTRWNVESYAGHVSGTWMRRRRRRRCPGASAPAPAAAPARALAPRRGARRQHTAGRRCARTVNLFGWVFVRTNLEQIQLREFVLFQSVQSEQRTKTKVIICYCSLFS